MTTIDRVTSCLVCGAHNRDTSELDGVVRRCSSCTFQWTAVVAPPAEALYDAGYYAGGGYADYFVPAARRYEADRRIGWLLAHAAPATLLEVGCAGGFFVEAAVRAGIDAVGLEVSPPAVRYARDELGVNVEETNFESASLARAFAAVCAFHVLEHVEDPKQFLAAAWRAIEPGGVLAIEVPNITSAAANRQGLGWHALQPDYHRWHFGPVTLARLVTAAGFEMVTLDTVVLRSYMPPRFRRRQARLLIAADLRDLHTLRLRHPDRGELVRLVARRPGGAARRQAS